jgi:hypothetical protein
VGNGKALLALPLICVRYTFIVRGDGSSGGGGAGRKTETDWATSYEITDQHPLLVATKEKNKKFGKKKTTRRRSEKEISYTCTHMERESPRVVPGRPAGPVSMTLSYTSLGLVVSLSFACSFSLTSFSPAC